MRMAELENENVSLIDKL